MKHFLFWSQSHLEVCMYVFRAQAEKGQDKYVKHDRHNFSSLWKLLSVHIYLRKKN